MARIAAGSDHAGFRLKSELVQHLKDAGHEVVDLGTHTTESVDYPDFGEAVARAVAGGEADWGLACCGTGIGIAMAANKVAGIRAAVVHDVTGARLTRLHNDANIICLGERVCGVEVAKDAVDAFASTDFEGGRHTPRVGKIDVIAPMGE